MCAGVSFDLEPNEIRVLGALLEKQRTTPDAYPLSLNALRAACNQSTNRDPVVDYDEATIRDALHRLSRRRWARLASGPGSRAAKYRHLFDEALGLGRPELAVLAVLMLRGPQTPGELRQRTERLHTFSDAESLHAVLDTLIEREMVVRLLRRPGQKEERYAHLLAGEDAVEPAAAVHVPAAAATPDLAPPAAAVAPPPAAVASGSDHRLDRLEREGNELRGQVAELRSEVTELREEVAALRRELGG
jgi:uncharacterized protein YceH (UPF0502 family)